MYFYYFIQVRQQPIYLCRSPCFRFLIFADFRGRISTGRKVIRNETDLALTQLDQIATILIRHPANYFQKIENCYFNGNKDCSFVDIARDGGTIPVEDSRYLAGVSYFQTYSCSFLDIFASQNRMSKNHATILVKNQTLIFLPECYFSIF